MDKEGRILIVGATGDIGSAITAALAVRRWHLALIGRRLDSLLALKERMVKAGAPTVEVAAADLSDRDGMDTALALITTVDGPSIHHVVFSAGSSVRGDLSQVSWQDWHTAYAVKLFSAWSLLNVCSEILRPGSSLTFITGESGYIPNEDYVIGSVNAALATLIKSAALHLGPQGIRVNGVSPGPVAGQRLDKRRRAESTSSDIRGQRWYDTTVAHLPLRKIVQPQDIAEAVLFLMSARSITGEIVSVSAGRSGYRL